jgi:hypothetical protein
MFVIDVSSVKACFELHTDVTESCGLVMGTRSKYQQKTKCLCQNVLRNSSFMTYGSKKYSRDLCGCYQIYGSCFSAFGWVLWVDLQAFLMLPVVLLQQLRDVGSVFSIDVRAGTVGDCLKRPHVLPHRLTDNHYRDSSGMICQRY